MNSKELVAELSRRLGKTQKEMGVLLQVTADSVVGALQESTTIAMQGFGSLEVRKKQDRILINPTTKQKMVVPPKLSLIFKVGTTYKQKLKNLTTRGK
ncbi:MAG: HU family DNA-binding protein [Paludibacteraceae bacterium]|nr:HU family DNA-binding protein [Paludibacteraceae bacterium]MEE1174678.1 HU family DNA-binding protein [Paludibacteraceae bacterium]